MALVGSRRRHLGLTLEVPRPSYKPTRIHFPDPVPPPVTSYSSSSSSTSSSSSSSSVSDFEKLEVLGHGNGGTVYKVRHRHQNPNFYYAMKLLHSSDYSDPVLRRQISREINVFRRASDSPFVVRLHSVLSSDGPSCCSSSSASPALVLEYMDAGTLGTLLRRHRRLPESILPSIARKVLLGLSYLHSQKIVHRDIKPSNLLVNSAGEIKISDFGVSRIMTRSLDPCDSYVGTCAYMSPERFDPDTYGAKYDGYAADVWSLGLTVMELYLGHFPLVPQGQRPDWATLMCAICFGDPPELPVSASPELRGFVECCLRKEPSDRWSVAELLNHPFVNGDDVARSETAFRNLLDSNPTVKEDEL